MYTKGIGISRTKLKIGVAESSEFSGGEKKNTTQEEMFEWYTIFPHLGCSWSTSDQQRNIIRADWIACPARTHVHYLLPKYPLFLNGIEYDVISNESNHCI